VPLPHSLRALRSPNFRRYSRQGAREAGQRIVRRARPRGGRGAGEKAPRRFRVEARGPAHAAGEARL